MLILLSKKINSKIISIPLLFICFTVNSQESRLYSFYSCHDYYKDYALILVHNYWTYESGNDSTSYMYVAGGYIENGFYSKTNDTLCLFPQSILLSTDITGFFRQDTCILYREYLESKNYEYKYDNSWKLIEKGDSLSIIFDHIHCKDFNGFYRFPTINKLRKIPLKQTKEEKEIIEFRSRFDSQ